MKYLITTKEGMTQIFDETGRVHPVTVLSVSPNVVTQVKTADKDGYAAVQIGAGKKSKNKVSKPVMGHVKDLPRQAGLEAFRVLREFKTDGADQAVGNTLDASIFEKGDKVHVSALSKGKGFQGVVKRHGFHGGPRTHGQKHNERSIGSIGAKGPARVFKGKKMPGRTGHDRVTVKNLEVVSVDAENGKLMVRGAVPGSRGTLVEVRSV